MHKAIFFVRVKNSSQTVTQAAQTDEHNAVQAECLVHRLNDEQRHPSHTQVQEGGNPVKFSDEKDLQDNADDCDCPNGNEQGPALAVTDRNQTKRRVRPCNQQIYGCVIDVAENLLKPGHTETVIERR